MRSFYGDEQRALQDQFDTRMLADTLEAVIVQPGIDDEARAFIESRSFFFLSTVNHEGHPTVSHKGGAPGFVRVVDPRRSCSPATTATACSSRWATSPGTVGSGCSSSISRRPTGCGSTLTRR